MQQRKITDLRTGMVSNVDVCFPQEAETHEERYFEWTASGVTASFQTGRVSGGILRAFHHTPVFDEVETHVDSEMFYFLHGTALMLFLDMIDGEPDLNSAQIVRIKPGTQIVIHAGKAHFPAVAEKDEPVEIVVVSPEMDAPRKKLPEAVSGIK